jgi:hypothetical protein
MLAKCRKEDLRIHETSMHITSSINFSRSPKTKLGSYLWPHQLLVLTLSVFCSAHSQSPKKLTKDRDGACLVHRSALAPDKGPGTE